MRFVARRLIEAIVTLFGVSLVVFFVLRLTPGNPAQVLLGETATPEAIAELSKTMGLDKPLWVQYGIFLRDVLHGDLGKSISSQQPALPWVVQRLPATIQLSFAAMGLAILVGVPLGVVAAVRQRSGIDKVALFLAAFAQSVPGFWLGLMLIILFAVKLHWLPAFGAETPKQIIMPAVTLSFYVIGLIIRLSRSSVLDVLREDYIRTARSKGLGERVVIYRHALRNALIPIVTITGLQMGGLLGGAVITESVFNWPGIGTLAVLAIGQRDYPVVQVIVLMGALAFVLINLAVDFMYVYLDPRIRRA